MAVNIDSKKVQELREKTGAGMMDCKKALVDAKGDLDKAIEILRLKGAASAEKKADRVAKDGCVATNIASDGKSGVLLELNCETDFVASTDQFQALLKELLNQAAANKFNSAEQFPKEKITETIAKLGENITVGRVFRFESSGPGLVGAYLHPSNKPGISKQGVLVEVGTGNDASTGTEQVKTLVRDIAMQVAAHKADYVSRENIPADIINKEKEIYREQAKQEGKPEKILEKIVDGKLSKFYSLVCLVDQPFIKDDKSTVGQLIQKVSKEINDEIKVIRFGRIKVGESK